jgi:hypothetical protein
VEHCELYLYGVTRFPSAPKSEQTVIHWDAESRTPARSANGRKTVEAKRRKRARNRYTFRWPPSDCRLNLPPRFAPPAPRRARIICARDRLFPRQMGADSEDAVKQLSLLLEQGACFLCWSQASGLLRGCCRVFCLSDSAILGPDLCSGGPAEEIVSGMDLECTMSVSLGKHGSCFCLW